MDNKTMIGDAVSSLKDYFTIAEISQWIYDNYDRKSVSDYQIRKYLKEWCRHDRRGVWYKYKNAP